MDLGWFVFTYQSKPDLSVDTQYCVCSTELDKDKGRKGGDHIRTEIGHRLIGIADIYIVMTSTEHFSLIFDFKWPLDNRQPDILEEHYADDQKYHWAIQKGA